MEIFCADRIVPGKKARQVRGGSLENPSEKCQVRSVQLHKVCPVLKSLILVIFCAPTHLDARKDMKYVLKDGDVEKCCATWCAGA